MSKAINSTTSEKLNGQSSAGMTPSFTPWRSLPSSWLDEFEFDLAIKSFYCEVTESPCPTTIFVHSAVDIFNDNVQTVLDHVTKILDAAKTP